ncbi:MAG TPA: gamma-glutamyltransferase [Thermomicrobiales bacterium]|nr:gamma-glutamyltransferase [Thermomicrobiales bacterium]
MGTRSEWLIDKSEAVSREGMVTAMQPQAAEAGAEMLRRGGNAIDAAVATAFAVGVVEPFMSGVGGIAFMVYRDSSSGETICFDGSTVLPKAIRPDQFELLDPGQTAGLYGWRATKDDQNSTGWLAPGVPGMPALMGEAHQRHGRLPWSDLLQPAIRLAEDGFEVNHYVAMTTAWQHDRLSRVPESKRTFFRPNGAPLSPPIGGPGDALTQPDLARTLRLIAAQGPEVVYTGEVARLIADDMARNGGLITEEDLAAHQTLVSRASAIDYRDGQLLGQLQNTGDPTVAQALRILEGFDVASLGFQSAEAMHLIIEAIRLAFLDRLRYLGDPSLMPVPMEGIVSRDYAAIRRGALDPSRASPGAEPGDPWPFETTVDAVRFKRSAVSGDGQTTHVNVVDKDRNMVSLTSTLGDAYGSAVTIAKTGIVLNNATMWFDPVPGSVNSIGPGKRVMSAASPFLLLRDGAPYAAIGSPGGRRVISAVYQVIINLIDFEQGMQAAISAPRAHSEGPLTEISTRFGDEVIEALAAMGHQIARREDTLSASFFARPSGIRVHDDGTLRGGVFQYSPATAVGI